MAYINGKEILFNPQFQLTGSPAEVSTEAEMNAVLTADNVGKVYKYIGTTTDTYENGAYYVIEESE